MAESGYKQFCPVAMAAEILCSRWTVLVLRELIVGSTRFNDLRRGLPRMSPALLSKRLRELEAAGIVHRTAEPGRPGSCSGLMYEGVPTALPLPESAESAPRSRARPKSSSNARPSGVRA